MERSSFFNAVLSGETYDRIYTAEDYARYFGSFIGNGVFPTPSTNLQVVADSTSMDIVLKAGKGWINGYFYENTEDLTLNVPVADGVLNRIDRVVLRLDFINREIKAYVKKGTFASSPVAPSLVRNSDMYELGLADIKINKGVTKIVQADITDLRQNNNYCGLVAGVLKQIDTTDLFKQFQSTFDIWFEHVKGQLSTDAAGNLQNQIDVMKPHVDSYADLKANGGTIGTIGLQNVNATQDRITTIKSIFNTEAINADTTKAGTTLEALGASTGAFRPYSNNNGKIDLGTLSSMWNIIYGKELNLNGTFLLRNRSVNEDEVKTSKKNLNFCSTSTDGNEVGFLLETISGGEGRIRSYAGNSGKIDIGMMSNKFRDIFLVDYIAAENGYTKLPNQFILQWGVITIDLPYGGSANKLINFPLPFANECYAAFATADYDVAGDSRAATAGVIANAGVLKSSATENKTQLWLTVGHTPVASTGWGSGTRPIRVRWFTIGH